MQYRPLGRTGIKVSPYCLGAMMFGKIANPDHDEYVRMVHKALDFGINFVDTSDMYSRGESEEIIGKALKGRRDNVVVATKVFGPMGAIRTSAAARGAGSRARSRIPSAGSRPIISISISSTGRRRIPTLRKRCQC